MVTGEITPADFHLELSKVLEEFGIERTYRVLQSVRAQQVLGIEPSVQAVFSVISEVQSITVDELIYGNGRKNGRHISICLTVYFLNVHIGKSLEDIAVLINKKYSSCWQYKAYITNLSPESKVDKEVLALKETIYHKLQQQNIFNKKEQ